MRILTRAVVNERVDVKVDIAPEILAELEQKEDQANALALSLMAKENELEHLQVNLKVRGLNPIATAVASQSEGKGTQSNGQGKRAGALVSQSEGNPLSLIGPQCHC